MYFFPAWYRVLSPSRSEWNATLTVGLGAFPLMISSTWRSA